MAVVPSCLAGCGRRSMDSLAHYVLCPRIRKRVGAAALYDCREMSVPALLGFAATRGAGPGVGPEGARRVVFATLGYHRLRALRREGGSPQHSAENSVGVQNGARVFRELVTTIRVGRSGRALYRRAPHSGRVRDGVRGCPPGCSGTGFGFAASSSAGCTESRRHPRSVRPIPATAPRRPPLRDFVTAAATAECTSMLYPSILLEYAGRCGGFTAPRPRGCS